MTKAEQIKSALNNETMTFTELLTEANVEGYAYEQDYDNEITYFEFVDNSVAMFCGIDQTIIAYGSKE